MIIDTPEKTELAHEALIYENANGVIYARFRDEPKKSKFEGRWIIGGDPGAVARAQGDLMDYGTWKDICEVAAQNETLKHQLDKIVTTYYMIKDDRNEIQ